MIFNPIKHVLGFGNRFDSIRSIRPLTRIDKEKTLNQLCIKNRGCDLFTIYSLNNAKDARVVMNMSGLSQIMHTEIKSLSRLS